MGLLEILGLRDEEIICSSVPPYCIPLGNKVYEWLVNEFQNSDLHVIYAFSKDLQTVMSTVEEAGDVMYLSQNVVETFIDRIEVFNDEHVKIHFTFENVLADYAE